jgi:CheY-like chemotaxis protein
MHRRLAWAYGIAVLGASLFVATNFGIADVQLREFLASLEFIFFVVTAGLLGGGCLVHLAGDGLEAIEMARSVRPRVILLDLGLPRLNGYEACKRIRQEDPAGDTHIVALTGWGQEDDRRRTQEAGFDQHLVKPVDHDELIKLLTQFRTRPGSESRLDLNLAPNAQGEPAV